MSHNAEILSANSPDIVHVVWVITKQTSIRIDIVAGAFVNCMVALAPKVHDFTQHLLECEVMVVTENLICRSLYSIHVLVLAYKDRRKLRLPVAIRGFHHEWDCIVLESINREFDEIYRPDPRDNNANQPEHSLIAIVFGVHNIFCTVQCTRHHVLLKYSHFSCFCLHSHLFHLIWLHFSISTECFVPVHRSFYTLLDKNLHSTRHMQRISWMFRN